MSHLIKDLLLLASLEQNETSVPFQPWCLNDLVDDLTEEFLELAVAADIQLTKQVPFVAVYVLGNKSQLYRIVSNLTANAIQYTHWRKRDGEPGSARSSTSITIR